MADGGSDDGKVVAFPTQPKVEDQPSEFYPTFGPIEKFEPEQQIMVLLAAGRHGEASRQTLFTMLELFLCTLDVALAVPSPELRDHGLAELRKVMAAEVAKGCPSLEWPEAL